MTGAADMAFARDENRWSKVTRLRESLRIFLLQPKSQEACELIHCARVALAVAEDEAKNGEVKR
jgi:hypothetical protein